MKHTIAYLIQKAGVGNQSAIEQLAHYETLDIEDNEKYLVLTDKP